MSATTEESRKRVLVVDDDDSCCAALRTLLRGEGFDVDVANSGEAALLRIAECPPHVLLSDVRMPGMDGFALLREARVRNAFPVILMSADGKCEPEVLEAGAVAYVAKPLDIDVVVRAINHALALRTGRD
jgi:CheY-like chemotaxis protein